MARTIETTIIGGGIAGLACARRLHESNRPFVLITEDLGGRIRPSAAGDVNLGAYYVRADYDHVSPFVDRGRRIRRRQILRGSADGSFTRSDAPLLRHPRQTIRFVRLMRTFGRHYEAFKRSCLDVSQAEAIAADPYLRDLYHEPAPRFIERHQIDDLAREYLAPGIRATGFTTLHGLTAFTLLVGVLPLVIPMFEYRFRPDALTSGFEEALLFDSVTEVTPGADEYSVRTASGESFTAENVVVATPIQVSARLLDLGPLKRPLAAYMFLVRGDVRDPWSTAPYCVFPPGDPIFALARQSGGSTLVSTAHDDPDFARCFSTWEVIEHHHWDPAFHLEGDVLLECERQPGLYLVGDHNVCDLEDTYLTGVYAANRILSRSG